MNIVIHNLRKTLRFQTRAANERAVNVRLLHQTRDVVGLDRAAVENAQRARRLLESAFPRKRAG
jgi:hypothetical protein